MLADGVFAGPDRKSFDVERANLAYGLGHWTTLLWNTPWLSKLCSCGIRCTRLPDSGVRYAYKWPNRDHWQPTCHSTELEKEKLLLLGVTLAELTLASPIGVRIEDHDAKFLVEGNWIALRELLTILRRKAGRDTIAKAVQYCLDPDSTSSKDQFRPEHMEEYCEKILLP